MDGVFLGFHSLGHFLATGLGRHIAAQAHAFAVLRQRLLRLLDFVFLTRDHVHFGTGTSEAGRDHKTNAAGSAGDDRYLAFD